MSEPLTIRFRVDFGSRCSVGIGKIQLLEAIDRSGSRSQAARLLKMSYRRAWLLMADLNPSFDQPVADTATGEALSRLRRLNRCVPVQSNSMMGMVIRIRSALSTMV